MPRVGVQEGNGRDIGWRETTESDHTATTADWGNVQTLRNRVTSEPSEVGGEPEMISTSTRSTGDFNLDQLALLRQIVGNMDKTAAQRTLRYVMNEVNSRDGAYN